MTAGRMTFGPILDKLAKQWGESPSPTLFAALADGMRKRGALAEAADLVVIGLERYPGYLPGMLVGVRIARDQGESNWAEAALRGILEGDPEHPVARELALEVSPSLLDGLEGGADSVATEDDLSPGYLHFEDPDENEIVTESLAALYHQQGHLDQALAAYAALAEQDPANEGLPESREKVRREILARRPLPLDSKVSGGQSLASLLQSVASARPQPDQREASFDAFFDPPPAPVGATTDFGAFQDWLKELDS